MRDAFQDIRFAVRTLLKVPTFTAISVITIALGVGATTAVFSMVEGVLLRRLPYAADSRLVHILQPSNTFPDVGLSYLEIKDYAEQVPEIAGRRRVSLDAVSVVWARRAAASADRRCRRPLL